MSAAFHLFYTKTLSRKRGVFPGDLYSHFYPYVVDLDNLHYFLAIDGTYILTVVIIIVPVIVASD